MDSFLRIELTDDADTVRDETVPVALTVDEIHELFSRVLKSPEQDNPVSDSALQKLARALDRQTSRQSSAA